MLCDQADALGFRRTSETSRYREQKAHGAMADGLDGVITFRPILVSLESR